MAEKVNIVIEQGATFSADFELMDANNQLVNLTEYTANAHLRRHYESNTAIVFSANTFANGIIRIGLTANQTSNLQLLQHVYDVKLTNPEAEVTRIVEGVAHISPAVTR